MSVLLSCVPIFYLLSPNQAGGPSSVTLAFSCAFPSCWAFSSFCRSSSHSKTGSVVYGDSYDRRLSICCSHGRRFNHFWCLSLWQLEDAPKIIPTIAQRQRPRQRAISQPPPPEQHQPVSQHILFKSDPSRVLTPMSHIVSRPIPAISSCLNSTQQTTRS